MALLDDVRQRLGSVFGAARRRAQPGDVRHRHVGHGSGGREPDQAGDARARRSSPATSAIGSRRCSSATAPTVTASRSSGDAPAIRRGRPRARREPADIVAMVHAETSTGVVNPGRGRRGDRARARRAHDRRCGDVARRRPVDDGRWGIDACYSCTQKGLGAPSGLAPITFSSRALERRGAAPQLLSRSRAARGLLAPPQVPPHDLGAARVRAARGARRGRGGRRSTRAGRGISGITRRSPPASTRWACRCCRRRPNGCGR